MGEAAKSKLEALRQYIADGDFVKAGELLRTGGLGEGLAADNTPKLPASPRLRRASNANGTLGCGTRTNGGDTRSMGDGTKSTAGGTNDGGERDMECGGKSCGAGRHAALDGPVDNTPKPSTNGSLGGGTSNGGISAITIPPLSSAVTLCQAFPELATCPSPGGKGEFGVLRRTLEQVGPDHIGIARRYEQVLRGARQRVEELEASAELCRVTACGPEDLLFFDIECCGLTSATIFLVGTMYFRDGQLVFEQLLAADYSQEAAVLEAFAARLEGAGVLVSFNGRAFDMNMIRERSIFHGLGEPTARVPHLDLLHESRRRWKRKLPNCRLQTLERMLCGRHRVGDIPGWAIADAYHQFVGSGDARQMRDIVHHNLLDLLTMAEVLCMVLTGYEVAE